jgi:hypothetical protein
LDGEERGCAATLGTCSLAPHCRHLTRRPAGSSGPVNTFLQLPHRTRIVIGDSPLPGIRRQSN